MIRKVPVSDFLIGPEEPLTLILGPCVIESEDSALYAAEFIKNLAYKKGFQCIYKSSYDKANRTSGGSFRGLGIENGLNILNKVKEQFYLPVLTDVHSPEEAKMAADVCDVIQIPAFLCRQTDLIVAAAQTKAVINVKKGQFVAPWDMKNVIEKILACGNEKILLTERGTCFGYNNLVNDFRSIPIMKSLGCPVVFDATHSVQLPGGLGQQSGGQREFISPLSKAAIACGCDALFLETHPQPSQAKSDGASMIAFADLPLLIDEVLRIYEALNVMAMK